MVDEEALVVVLDNGSGMVKAGFAGEEAPQCVFPAIVGRPRGNQVTMQGAASKSEYIGEEAMKMKGVLNINYPAREANEITGVVWARIGRGSHFDFGYERAGPDRVRIVFAGGESRETIEGADTTLFDAGNVTLTLLDGDLIALPDETQRVREPLHGVNP